MLISGVIVCPLSPSSCFRSDAVVVVAGKIDVGSQRLDESWSCFEACWSWDGSEERCLLICLRCRDSIKRSRVIRVSSNRVRNEMVDEGEVELASTN